MKSFYDAINNFSAVPANELNREERQNSLNRYDEIYLTSGRNPIAEYKGRSP
jgi:hypothetical protein